MWSSGDNAHFATLVTAARKASSILSPVADWRSRLDTGGVEARCRKALVGERLSVP